MRPRLPISVREANLDDAPVLADLWHAAALETAVADQASALWHRPEPAEAVEALGHQLSQSHRTIWVAEHEGAVVAAAAASIGTVSPVTATRMLIVTDLVVDPARRRHGIARSLIRHLSDFADLSGCEIVVAVVPGSSREPSRYLAKVGFSQAASVRAISSSSLRARLAGSPASAHARRALAARRSMRRRTGGTPL